VACHEQNNTPVDVIWRRVGEIEGVGPDGPKRFHISMACNHCLDPACMTGCPVDAYYKDETTGVVLLKKDACIGCQYCTWNCPYGAPQYHPERKQITKCDLCYHRLEAGDSPACVSACPSGALQFEKVEIESWKQDLHLANAPGVPDASLTLSTTRFTLPKDISNLRLERDPLLKPEKPHYSLIFLTVLTQLSVGGFFALSILGLLDRMFHLPEFLQSFLKIGAMAMLGTALVALLASVFHLGRPFYAYRALKMWRRSWLSREVLFFTLFALSAALFSLWEWGGLSFPLGIKIVSGFFVIFFGFAGVYSSARIYMVPARPSWNTPRTLLNFFMTALLLGPLTALLVYVWNAHHLEIPFPLVQAGTLAIGKVLAALILIAGCCQLLGILVKLFYSVYQEQPELQGSAKLLLGRYRTSFLLRLAGLIAAMAIIPLALFDLVATGGQSTGTAVLWLTVAFLLALGSEGIGRYLFFVTVVPKNRPDAFLV
jgi:Fe-S-cluster-containing dehydrogenase component/DMSO reductase anchor subunit